MGKQSEAQPSSQGRCGICGKTFSKRGMGRHLETCLKQQAATAKPGKSPAGEVDAFHLAVNARYYPEYWLHLLAGPKATLGDLDGFLRQIWLETYDHLSAFTIGNTTFESGPPLGEWNFSEDASDEEDDAGEEDDYEEEDIFEQEDAGSRLEAMAHILGIPLPNTIPQLDLPAVRSMDAEFAEVLHPKLKFTYEYDFGTTTELALTVVGQLPAAVGSEEIRLLSRNDPPEIPCGVCGKPAVTICSDCVYEPEGWLCKKCARKHECDEEMFLPVVNSPRTGVCGYAG